MFPFTKNVHNLWLVQLICLANKIDNQTTKYCANVLRLHKHMLTPLFFYVCTSISFIKMRYSNAHLTHIANAPTRTKLYRDFNERDEFFVCLSRFFLFLFLCSFDQNKSNATHFVAEVVNGIYLRAHIIRIAALDEIRIWLVIG